MTRKQKLLAILTGVVATIMFIWPVGLLFIWGCAEINGDIPTKEPAE